jgi:hypothetical protein
MMACHHTYHMYVCMHRLNMQVWRHACMPFCADTCNTDTCRIITKLARNCDCILKNDALYKIYIYIYIYIYITYIVYLCVRADMVIHTHTHSHTHTHTHTQTYTHSYAPTTSASCLLCKVTLLCRVHEVFKDSDDTDSLLCPVCNHETRLRGKKALSPGECDCVV